MSDDITLGAGIAAVADESNNVRIYVMDVNGAIRELQRNGGEWHKGQVLPDLEVGAGKVGAGLGASTIDLGYINVNFIRASDLKMRTIEYGDDGSSSWASQNTHAVAATIMDKKRHMRRVYWQFDDSHVWEVVQAKEDTGGFERTWQWNRGANFGPAMKGTSIACISWGEVPGNMRVFFQNEKGVIIEKAWTGSSWSTRELEITDAVARTPLAVTRMDEDHIRLFYVNREWKVKEKLNNIRRVSPWNEGWINVKVAANTHIAALGRPYNTVYVQEGTNGSAFSEWSWAMKERSWSRTKESIPI
ncbi:Fungal fucose-specific lectin [Ophiocordyceps camponoti-floridani]|uniref:Fungal fucose-specific lectin n=1 Tax=Ophiocordyceps camponoti-floridani TaxID=2030778 RepID=A0A8H4QCI2_9HYPO|nr:Fungal fucose-specific lectin [Ophiocordyceps camponoti-floridani]